MDNIVKFDSQKLQDKDYTVPMKMPNMNLNNGVSSEKRNKLDQTIE